MMARFPMVSFPGWLESEHTRNLGWWILVLPEHIFIVFESAGSKKETFCGWGCIRATPRRWPSRDRRSRCAWCYGGKTRSWHSYKPGEGGSWIFQDVPSFLCVRKNAQQRCSMSGHRQEEGCPGMPRVWWPWREGRSGPNGVPWPRIQ